MEITADILGFSWNDESSGSSREATVARRRRHVIRKRTYLTASRQPSKILAYEIITVYLECRRPNWDGYGARAVNSNTYRAAMRIAEIAPDFGAIPEVMADADGDIAFEWNRGESSLTVVVNADEELAYAGYFGDGAQVHGSEKLNDRFPETIARLIDRVHGDQDLR